MKTLRFLGPICLALAVIALTGCFGAGLVPDEDDGGSAGGEEPSVPDGTVTVSLSGAAEANGDYLLAYAYEAGEWITDMQEYVVGAGMADIVDGSASFVLSDSINVSWEPTGDEWNATGGENYDLYIYTYPADGSAEMGSRLDPWTTTVAVDGDTTVAVDYADFVPYTPTGGTLTVSISGAQEQEEHLLFFGVFQSPSDPSVDDALAFGEAVIPTGGSVSIVAQEELLAAQGTQNWPGAAEGEYDVYLLIDTDDSGTGGPTDGDLAYRAHPITYWQYGDKVMPTRYEDYETVHIVTPPVD